MKIKIVAAGKLKNSPLLDLCQEYLKRISWSVTLKEVDAHKAADPNSFTVLLDERGETLSSPDFAKKLGQWRTQAPGNEITLLIGGPDGFSDDMRKQAKFLMSFGKQTWPHMLVRVMLLEQIYRAQQILAGHPYHRD